jgi:hypothetical protein
MRSSISNTVLAGLPALAISAIMALSSSAAAAFQIHGGGMGGFHGGFGGFHPGFGGFHPGFVHGPGFFHHGFAGRHVFFNRHIFVGGPGGCWGGWCGGWWWPGFATGAVVGAAAAYPYSDYGYGYDNGCWVYRPAYRRGVYVGRYLVNVCY